ncbi:MAG: S9 family peptidase [Rhizomicrobium sp.]
MDAFGTLPQISQPSLSPDGKHLATVEVYKGRPVAVIRTLDPPGQQPVILPYEDGFIVRVQWANNDRLLITINSNAKVWGDQVNPWYRTVSIDTLGQNAVIMFSDARDRLAMNYSASNIVDLALNDPDHIYMAMWADEKETEYTFGASDVRYSVFQVDVTNGRSHRVFLGGEHTNQWIMDGHGQPIARVDQTLLPLTDHLMLHTAQEDWKEVETADASGGRGLDVDGPTEDGTAIVERAVSDKLGTYEFIARNLTDLKEKELFSDPHYDVDGALADPWTGRVIGASVITDQVTDNYFNPELQALQRGLAAAFPGYAVHAVDWDLNRQKVIAIVSGPQQPPRYYLLDRTTHHAILLGRTYEGLQSSDLGEVKPYPYKARDGLDIPAYLTLPPGKTPKNLPVVIFPHGGPMARDWLHFDYEAQFLANRGYAVLQPNFRGSSGYGKKFMEAGYGQWGLKMQDDITDGVKKLIADGIADPKRICIYGGSYGGYAALAGAAFTPDLYACAASWAGVSDLRQFLATRKESSSAYSAEVSAWTRFIGDRSDDATKLDAASPALNADKIKCPVLLMHGKDDATVRIDQSEEMDEALRHAGKKVTLIEIDKETHYMQMSSTRIQVLTELEKFLKENIGN